MQIQDTDIQSEIQAQLQEVLITTFGLEKLRDKQAEAISLTMSGKHVLSLLPTGYGKSLCYQLPSQLLPGVTLVISPLIALMEDQLNGLKRRGIKNATLINSSLHPEELSERLDGIAAGQYKLIYLAPERLDSQRFANLIKSLDVSLLVIDEAHCISQWGHDFRPQYRHMKRLIEMVPKATVLALTATATLKVQKDIVSNLGIPMEVVKGDFDRPNLTLTVEKCENPADKDRILFDKLREVKPEEGSSIVYVSSRKEAEGLAKRLTDEGFKAAFYHAGLPAPMRKGVQKRFEEDQIKVIVCTVAFGMGVDKATIRRVVHYNLPPSLENYYQEAGRAGRDGQAAACCLLYQPKDIYTQRWLMKNNYPTDKQVQDVYALLRQSKTQPMRPSTILESVDIKDSALHSTLDLFNQLGILQLTPGGVMLKEEPEWLDTSILNRRKDQDEDRLERMISYATLANCRRKTILSYFGQTIGTTCSGCDVCHPHTRHASMHRAPVRGFRKPERKDAKARLKTFGTANSAYGNNNSNETGSYDGGYIRGDLPQTQPRTNAQGDAPSQNEIHNAIISLTGELKGQVGRTTIAGILSGSKAKKLNEKGFDKLDSYGKYSHKKAETILDEIDQLIEQGSLRVIPGMYPKLAVN